MESDNSFYGNFKAWLGAPYRAPMSALDWFLFVGLLIVILAVWRIVLSHLDIG